MVDQYSWLEVSLTTSGELAEAVAEVFSRFVSDGVVIESETVFNPAEQEAQPTGNMRVFGYLPFDDQLEKRKIALEEALWHRIFVGPERLLPVGVLLEMWRAGRMAIGEADDEDRVLVFASAGSPLSGAGWFKGVRPGNGEVITGKTRGDPRLPRTTSWQLTCDCIDAGQLLADRADTRCDAVSLPELIDALRLLE